MAEPLLELWAEEDPPEFEVWIYIRDGIESAEKQLEYLDPKLAKVTAKLGEVLIENRTKLVLDGDEQVWAEADAELLNQPWIKFAAELHLADEGVERASRALKRYQEIVPAVSAHPLPEGAVPYISEVTKTFLFGFDAACIALCRAAVEQLLKDRLVSRGVYTREQIKRLRFTAGTCLEECRHSPPGLADSSAKAAKRVIEYGNRLMHSHVDEPQIIHQLARDSVEALSIALVELAP